MNHEQCCDPRLGEKLINLDQDTSQQMAELFKMLGDVTRIRLLALIARGEMRVGDIAEAMGMQQSAVSHQLRVLRTTRLVRCRRDGKEAWYAIDDDHVLKLMRLGLDHASHR